MKKLIVAFIMLLVSSSMVIACDYTSIDPHVYTGISSGIPCPEKKLSQYDQINFDNLIDFFKSTENINIGGVLGYYVNPYVSLQIDSNIYGKIPKSFSFSFPNINSYDIQYSTKITIPIIEYLNSYVKFGSVLENFNNKNPSVPEKNSKESKNIESFITMGLEYLYSKNTSIYLDYNFKDEIHNLMNLSFNPSLKNLNFGFLWNVDSLKEIIKKNIQSNIQNNIIYDSSKKSDFFV